MQNCGETLKNHWVDLKLLIVLQFITICSVSSRVIWIWDNPHIYICYICIYIYIRDIIVQSNFREREREVLQQSRSRISCFQRQLSLDIHNEVWVFASIFSPVIICTRLLSCLHYHRKNHSQCCAYIYIYTHDLLYDLIVYTWFVQNKAKKSSHKHLPPAGPWKWASGIWTGQMKKIPSFSPIFHGPK